LIKGRLSSALNLNLDIDHIFIGAKLQKPLKKITTPPKKNIPKGYEAKKISII